MTTYEIKNVVDNSCTLKVVDLSEADPSDSRVVLLQDDDEIVLNRLDAQALIKILKRIDP